MAELQSTPAELRAAAAASSKAKERLTYLFDDGKYNELDAFASGKTLSGVICAFGKVNGSPCYAFSQDVSRNLGALDCAQAKKISRTLRLAAETGVPVVGIYDSCGADLNDGHKALIERREASSFRASHPGWMRWRKGLCRIQIPDMKRSCG